VQGVEWNEAIEVDWNGDIAVGRNAVMTVDRNAPIMLPSIPDFQIGKNANQI
jgi:hypothetical protein